MSKQYIDPDTKKVLATICIENQFEYNSPNIAKKALSCDAVNYCKQLDQNFDDGHIVVTLVLIYDNKKEGSTESLLESLSNTKDKVVEKLISKFASDYKPNCFNCGTMTLNDLDKYGMSDLKYFLVMYYDYIHSPDEHRYLSEFINICTSKRTPIIINNPELLEAAIYSLTENEYYKDKVQYAIRNLSHLGDGYRVCDILKVYSENIRNESKIEGERIGLEKGVHRGRKASTKEFIMNMLKNNKSDDEIKTMVPDCTDDLINEVRRDVNK